MHTLSGGASRRLLCFVFTQFFVWWGVAKGSSLSWVAKLKGEKHLERKLSNGQSRSYKVTKLLLSAGKCVVAKFQGDKSDPNLPWNFITHGFLDPSAFPHLVLSSQ